MSINVKFKGKAEEETKFKFPLAIRKTVDGRIMITDHPDIDIVFIPEQSKIVAFTKESFGDHVYASQNILFDYLTKKGIILPDSIKGGNVYGSIEAIIPESKNEVDPIKLGLMSVAKFIEEEREHFKFEKEYNKMINKNLYAPTDEKSTELGEVPHSERKGNIHPGMMPYNYGGSFGMYEE